MRLTQLDRECLLHIFSFLDREARRRLSLTCRVLRGVFLEPSLWRLLRFSSPSELRRRDFVLGPSLCHLAVRWHSSRVKVCNVEEWMKSAFQRDICSKHERLVSAFLARVSSMCPNLLSVTLSGCGHISDGDVIGLLRGCVRLRSVRLEDCARLTDGSLRAVLAHGPAVEDLRVDFCRNVTREGLQEVRERRPKIRLSAERSAGMIPDSTPEERLQLRRSRLQKVLLFS